ncbi:MAG: type IV secretion system DNA-binding domain-containing protein, partial [bacterium]|nr:type IV secretion system DNA-binding domain-containing protein [bacterium]
MAMKYEHDHENDVIYFAKTNFRNALRKFGIKTDDRRRHMYVIGKTGMGKSTLLENMFLSDMYAGHGCCYIDPHGDTAEKFLNFIPSWRINDVVYFNPADVDNPVGFNILESVDDSMKHLVAAGMMGVFKKIWENVWSARMEYILNNTILALLDTPGTTLLGINRMLSDKDYREAVIFNVKDPIVKQFWVKEFAQYADKFASEAVAPIQNKVGQFLSASIIRNIVAQPKSTINIRQIMDGQQIFIVNLSKGRIGEDASRLLGGMIITKIQMAGMERVDIPESERQDFYLFVDEFQNFAVESFASILSEARKYRLNLIMAHQYIAQLTEEVRDAVFGNVGTMVTFRVGSPDAIFMEDEFKPRFTPEDIINLPKFSIYLKLMIDGVSSQPFSAATLPPIGHLTGVADKVIEQSRLRYAGNRSEIEDTVAKWSGFGEDVDLEAEMQKVKDEKKLAKKARYSHDYNCTRCNKEFQLPVELDRSRPIYCEDCMPLIKEERKKGKKKGKNETKRRDEQKIAVTEAPKVKEGDVVAHVSEETVSLRALTPKTPHDKIRPEQGIVADKHEVSEPQKLPAQKAPTVKEMVDVAEQVGSQALEENRDYAKSDDRQLRTSIKREEEHAKPVTQHDAFALKIEEKQEDRQNTVMPKPENEQRKPEERSLSDLKITTEKKRGERVDEKPENRKKTGSNEESGLNATENTSTSNEGTSQNKRRRRRRRRGSKTTSETNSSLQGGAEPKGSSASKGNPAGMPKARQQNESTL